METQQVDDYFVTSPSVDIVASQLESLRAQFLEHIQQGHTNLVIDLSNVGIIDSKGLALFAVCNKTVKDQSGKLTVVTNNADFKKLFRVTRLDQHFEVRESL